MRSLVAALIFLALSLLPATGQCLQQTVSAPQPSPIRTGLQIQDIQGPVLLPEAPSALYAILAALLVLAIAITCSLLVKRRRKPESTVPGPDAIALRELKLAGEFREQPLLYAEKVSAILRQYIESRFQVRSTRQTTREFFTCLQQGTTIAEVDLKIHARDLQECMEQCDRAKFAHGTPDQDDMTGMDRAVRKFIETTSPGPDAGFQTRTGDLNI